MISGIGVDIIENKRFAKALLRKGFIKKVFSSAEIKYCESKPNKVEHYAGRFAAKEAILKALGTGLANGITWHDIEIKKNAKGNIATFLHKKAKKSAQQKRIKQFFISITHTKNYAAAFAIAEN